MTYPIVYLRSEPARDGTPKKNDVVAFRESNGKIDFNDPIARWPWHNSNKPDRRRKYTMLNCHRHRIVWLNHMGKPE